MERKKSQQIALIPQKLQEAGGLRKGIAQKIAKELSVPEAHVYGVGRFFHLLSKPDTNLRICQGLSCQLSGASDVLQHTQHHNPNAEGCSCLAMCNRPVAALRERTEFFSLEPNKAIDSNAPIQSWDTHIRLGKDKDKLVNRLHLAPSYEAKSYQKALALRADQVIKIIADSQLQGRGGAGFPAGFKWRSVAEQTHPQKYVVLNADEGEPGTFKDRAVLIKRPDTVLEGLAIAATAVGASEVYCYLRGAFTEPWQKLSQAIERFRQNSLFRTINFHLHEGQGAYICGEETALLEALEGKRGMPRIKPPYPTVEGLWGKPTLIHNVETIACVPAIIENGAKWFQKLGKTGAGTKLYSISGHVKQAGVYEMPLGICLDELVEAAGGYTGELKAFSPGGASSGFLPASERKRPLDFQSLTEVGSMLGSAGVVVLNQSVDMVEAAYHQLAFFEEESCGQCAPCRIGTRFLKEALDRLIQSKSTDESRAALEYVKEVAWEMNEGSICGLGQTAPLPLTSAMRWFPEEFKR